MALPRHPDYPDLIGDFVRQAMAAVAEAEAALVMAGCAVCGSPVTTRLTRPHRITVEPDDTAEPPRLLVVQHDVFVCDRHAERWLPL